MGFLRDLIGNDVVYYALIFLGIAFAVNVLSKFVENIFLLIKNFKVIGFYLRKSVVWSVKTFLKIIFFPFTFWGWIKEYSKYNQFVVNNSRYREDDH